MWMMSWHVLSVRPYQAPVNVARPSSVYATGSFNSLSAENNMTDAGEP